MYTVFYEKLAHVGGQDGRCSPASFWNGYVHIGPVILLSLQSHTSSTVMFCPEDIDKKKSLLSKAPVILLNILT